MAHHRRCPAGRSGGECDRVSAGAPSLAVGGYVTAAGPSTAPVYRRADRFSYHCGACGRCCHGKRIPLGPYDILRLARHLGLKTGEFLQRYAEHAGPWLRATGDGACVFLDAGCCTVHADRPLACRVYPLGRWVTAGGEETFGELPPHPETEGRYGRDGTVAQYLLRQGAPPYLEAVDRYQALFYRLFDALQAELPGRQDLLGVVPEMFGRAAGEGEESCFVEWLDADGAVARYCEKHELSVPDDIDRVMDMHIQAIDEWLHSTTGARR